MSCVLHAGRLRNAGRSANGSVARGRLKETFSMVPRSATHPHAKHAVTGQKAHEAGGVLPTWHVGMMALSESSSMSPPSRLQ
jgi:hypothetical protein